MLEIITYPNQILKNENKLVELPLNQEIQELIKKMMKKVEGLGVGLAAPQVGVNLKLCIIRLDPEMADKKDKELHFVMINPIIEFYSQITNVMVEGCLSFPKEFYKIERPSNIKVKYQTISNFNNFLEKNEEPLIKSKTLLAGNWLARVIQHETDHLNGILFIEKGVTKIDPKNIDKHQVVD